MIINKLEMFNFRQYVGHQTVTFSTDKHKNVTVLVGINTSGKTTLVRAFEWCLYGKNGFDDPVLLNSDVRANMNTGDRQETWVAVTFTHDEKVYTIKRTHRYTCTERKKSSDGIEVALQKKPEEQLSLVYLQNDGQTKTPIDRSNINESMDRVLPRDLSDYFFFGGERISGIANRTDLTKAVRGLMGLDILENARDHLSKVLKSFQASIDTSGDASAQRARDAIETYNQQLAVYETYQQKEATVRTQLQNRVNENFSKMYHGERSITIDDKYRVRYTDVKTEESDGLKAVKSFAFIASLVSMAKDKILDDAEMQLGQEYPIVMDAPFSNVDEIHINNICQILPNTANQVIMAVMKKDWDYAADNLAGFVGMSYLISKDTDADGNEIETSTHIVRAEV